MGSEPASAASTPTLPGHVSDVSWCDLRTLHSAYGSIRAHLHEAPDAVGAAVLVGGIGNDVDGPGGSYLDIAERLLAHGINSIRVSYTRTGDLLACVHDVLAALDWCREHGFDRVVLVGWSFGGAVVITAGAGHGRVAGVATVATQGYDAAQVQAVSPRPLLLVHGTADPVLPAAVSMSLHRAAREPKRLVLLEGAGHDIAGHEQEFVALVVEWAVQLLVSSGEAQAG